MPRATILCSCDAVLTEDEREHYLYQCTACVVREHDALRAHRRGEDHPDLEMLLSGPVLIDGLVQERRRRAA
jgi:hypothetical protein